VVVDAGKGIERGVQRANEACAPEAQEWAAARLSAMGLAVLQTQRALQHPLDHPLRQVLQ